jgi:hypothetical protein
MCGPEGRISIEPAENGMTIDVYTPSSDGPGKRRKLIAADAEHAVRMLKPHLVKVGKKAGKFSKSKVRPAMKSKGHAVARKRT